MTPTDYQLLPEMPPELADLVEVATDLRLSTIPIAQRAWERVDPELWNATRNPWLLLQTISRARLQELAKHHQFRDLVRNGMQQYRHMLEAPGWLATAHPGSPLGGVAYFSLEFGLSDALPIYSGGLGNVAGDQLKSASDLGVPVTGIGLLYQQGYFRQMLDAQGGQREFFPYNDPRELPIQPVRGNGGEWLRIALEGPGRRVLLRVWQARVGRCTLYLLDSNDPGNAPPDRGITSELYGGGAELRLQQEIVLGIGGWTLVRDLGLAPEVCHLNEGHAAFAILARAAAFMEDHRQPFGVALAATRAGNLFTTHTPVAAGFDRFDPALLEHYLGEFIERRLGLEFHQCMALGRLNADDRGEPFNMAYLALRGSGWVNGVSRLHGQVSRYLFRWLFPRWPVPEVPVGHVTNGVHVPSWVSAEANTEWTGSCGGDIWLGCSGEPERRLDAIDDARLWRIRTLSREKLVRYVRVRLRNQLRASGLYRDWYDECQQALDPHALTLGFARRFATYKRPTLLLRDEERLVRLLNAPGRPVQLIVAGKAHPADDAGKAMVRQWVRFLGRADVRGKVVFLSDYDITLAEHLVEGVDVWVNTPRRPWEASGTSGMKVLANGGINLSELDGWWAEAYAPDVGWALGDGREHADANSWDAAEAEALYRLLEREVVPEFYDRDAHGTPTRWVARMRASMSRLVPRFSSNRTVREYTERYYLPAAAAYHKRSAGAGTLAGAIEAWRAALDQHWDTMRFGAVAAETRDGRHRFRAEVHLGDVAADDVRVELYAEARSGAPTAAHPMQRGAPLAGAGNAFTFTAEIPAERPAADFTARVVPCHPDALVPLEASHVLWQR